MVLLTAIFYCTFMRKSIIIHYMFRSWILGIILTLFLPVLIFSNETIPDQLRWPMRTEAPRYPRDRVIGALGQGTAPDGAWQYARLFLSALVQNDRNRLNSMNISSAHIYTATLENIQAWRYHVGGGRTEEDGSVSFLVRFFGRTHWITGELYLRQEDNDWYLDDLLLEDARSLEEGNNIYQYDFSPYERFF